MTYRTPTEGKFWAQSDNHRIAYAAHGVKALMDKRSANPVVRKAQYALMRAMLDPIEKFDWGTWFTKNHYKPDAVEKSNPEGINQYTSGHTTITDAEHKLLHNTGSAEKLVAHLNAGHGTNFKPDRYHAQQPGGKPGFRGLGLHYRQVHQEAHRLGRITKQASLASTGAFMALLPRPEDAHLLASQEERPEDLHCTLAFFGNAVDLSQTLKRRIMRVADRWASRSPFNSTLNGSDRFGEAFVVTILDPALMTARADLVADLKAVAVPVDEKFPSYKPHVTLSYHDDLTGGITAAGSTWTGGSIVFDRVLVAFGDVQYVVPLMIRKAEPSDDDVLGSIDPIIDLYKKRSKAKIDQAVKDLNQAAQAHVVAQLNVPFDPADLQAGIDAAFEQYGSNIANTSADDLRGLLDDVLATGPGNPADFKKALLDGWSEFTRDKADQIAWTEYNNVASQATLHSYQQNGVEYKAWLTVGDDNVCPECQTNEDEGPIPIDQEFPSGDDAPPQHPDCRCNITSVVSPDTAIEGDVEVTKGDLPGHEFHGNQWTEGTFYQGSGSGDMSRSRFGGKGTQFFSPHRGVAEWYGPTVREVKLQPGAKIADLSDPKVMNKVLRDEFERSAWKRVREGHENGNLWEQGMNSAMGDDQERVLRSTQRLGYDAVKLTDFTPVAGDPGYSLVVHNMDKVLVTKGDVPGHEFHGNQYTEGATAGKLSTLSSDQLKKVQDTLGKTMLNGWVGRDQLSVKELADFIHAAAEQHGLDDVDDPKRAEHDLRDAHRLIDRVAVKKGDVEGHEFHGNQYTGGEGGAAKPFVDQNTVPRQTKLGPVDFQESGDVMGQEYHATYSAFPVNASNGAERLGYVSVAYDHGSKGNAYIKMIEVPEQYRRMGVATALLDRVKAEVPHGKVHMLGNFATDAGQGLMAAAGIKPPAPPSKMSRVIQSLKKDFGGGAMTTGDLNSGGMLAPQQGLKRRKGDRTVELAIDPATGKYRATKTQDLPD